MALRIVLSLCLLASTTPIFAQKYLAELQHFSVVEGLSHREVFAIHQDQEGFIWLATKSGLNRFDGQQFRSWTVEEDALETDEHHYLFEDDQGIVWAFKTPHWFYQSHPTHIDLIYSRLGKNWTFEGYFQGAAPFNKKDIAGFIGNADRRLFFSLTDGQMFVYQNKTFERFRLPFSQPFYILAADPQEGIWGYTGEDYEKPRQLYHVSSSGKKLLDWELPEDTRAININFSETGDLTNAFVFSITAGGEHYQISRNGQVKKNEIKAINNALSLIFPSWDRQATQSPMTNHFWLKSMDHLLVLDAQGNSIFNVGESFPELSSTDIHRIFFDQKGGAWLATTNGFYVLHLNPNRFQQYLYLNEQELTEKTPYSCRGIYTDGKQLWINTYQGRQQINLQAGTLERMPFLPYTSKSGTETLSGYYPLAIHNGKENVLWFGDFIILRHDLQTEEDVIYEWPTSLLKELDIWSLHQDEQGKLWLGTNQGLAYLDEEKEQLEVAFFLNDNGDLGKSTVYSFVPSLNNTVWLATTSGLYEWTPSGNILNRWCVDCAGKYHLPNDEIYHVHEDQSGLLWLATTEGLIQLDPSEKTGANHFRQFTTADGLSNNKLYAVYGDARGNLWMSSDYGIIVFNKKGLQARAYLPSDGTTHSEFNRISHFQSEDGKIYFGSLNGVTALDPVDFYKDQNPLDAPLQITKYQQWDGTSDEFIDQTNELLETQTIRLEPKDRFFRLEFALLNYEDPLQNRYAWQLDGLDQGWTYTKDPFIRVSGLAADSYTLRIKGQTGNGQWSEEIRLNVQVLEPIYRKAWFWGLIFVISALAAFFVYRWRFNQLNKRQMVLENLVRSRTHTIEQQAEELRQMDRLKSRFFTNVSHELRTPLSLMIGPIDSALKTNQLDNRSHTYLKLAQQNGQQLLKLVNEILDLAKLEAKEMQLNEKPLALFPYMRRIAAGFESWAESQQQHFEFHYRPDQYLKIQIDVDKLGRVLNNLLSNAFKFTNPGGSVTLVVEDLPNKLQVQVKDTGRGIREEDLPNIFNRFYQTKHPEQAEEGGTGIGLALCAEFARLMNGKLWVESTWTKGSTFFFEFPKKEVLGTLDSAEAEAIELTQVPAQISAAPLNTDQSLSRILLVEDNPHLKHYIQMILSDHYQVIACGHGAEALEQLKAWQNEQKSVDLILSDIMMPIMDGFQLLEKLKASDTYSGIPVILLTARADLQDRIKALRIGVDDYLVKPFIESELLARIGNLVNRYAKIQQASPEWERPTISQADLSWLAEQEELLTAHLTDPNFTVSVWANTVALSERQLQRKIRALTQLSPLQYLQEARLHQARHFLELGEYQSVAEVAHAVGFAAPATFSRNFKKRFGKSPSAYL